MKEEREAETRDAAHEERHQASGEEGEKKVNPVTSLSLDLLRTIGRTQSASGSRPNTAKLAAIRAPAPAKPRGRSSSGPRRADPPPDDGGFASRMAARSPTSRPSA